MKYASHHIKIMILFLFIFVLTPFSNIYAQIESDIYERPTVLDYVAVNNKQVEINKDGYITIQKEDTIKIAGTGIPNTNVVVFVNENEYQSIIDSSGNWFVIFSVTDLNEDINTVNAELIVEEVKQKIYLLSLSIEESKEIKEVPSEEKEIKTVEIRTPLFYTLLLLTISISAIIGALLSISFRNKSKRKNM